MVFFVNFLYIFIMYINKPTLIITDKELIQDGFYFKKIKINDLVTIVTNDSNVVFKSKNDKLKIKTNYIDSKTRNNLFDFINEQSLENYG